MMTRSVRIIALLAALASGARSAWCADETRLVDKDKDGRNETQAFYSNGVITKQVSDVNGDGRTDDTVTYKQGLKFLRESDRNFDGKLDHWYYYDVKGMLLRYESDANGDGKPDHWSFMERKLELILQEYDRNFDGKVDRRLLNEITYDRKKKQTGYQWQWKEEDNNFDGVIDVFRERRKKKSKNPPMPDRTGKKIDTDHKTMREPPPGSGSKSDPWNIESAVKERAELEKQYDSSQTEETQKKGTDSDE